jgi:hypothetical protein
MVGPMLSLNFLLVPLALLVALFVMLHVLSAMRVYRGAPQRRPRNVSPERRLAPATVSPLLGSLTLLGFRRLGEIEIEIEDTGLLGPVLRRSRRHTVWLLLDGPETTLCELVELGPMISLETWLTDGSVVQTTHPAGENIQAGGLHASVVRSSPTEAYDQHRRLLDVRSEAGTLPVPINSLGDYLRHDAMYRQRYARRFLRGPLLRRQLLPAGFTLAVICLLLYRAVSATPQ